MKKYKSIIRTLVVGGGGFIGSHLIQLLSEDSRRSIIVAGRRPYPSTTLPANVQYVSGDISNDVALMPLLDNADEVIDLAYASVPKTSFDDPVTDVLSNLPATVNLLQKASSRNLRRLMLVSSGGTVYGSAKYLPIDESHPTDPISPYGITKLATEKYALMYHRLAELPVIIVRPGNPYGPNQFGNLAQGFIGAAMYAAIKKQKVMIFGERGTIRDYIHIDDMCLGMIAALEYGTPGDIFNIGTGFGYDNCGILDLLSEVIKPHGYDLFREHLPARSFDVAANVLSSARLTYLSGWRPSIALEDGLAKTWDWVLDRSL